MRSDNGTEFTKGPLPVYLSKTGILHETTCVDTPQQNGLPANGILNLHMHCSTTGFELLLSIIPYSFIAEWSVLSTLNLYR